MNCKFDDVQSAIGNNALQGKDAGKREVITE